MYSELTVGERLKIARKAKLLTQEELGEMIGVKKSQISNIEKGSSELTRANAIVLSGKLGIDFDWLLSGEGDIATKPAAGNSGITGNQNWQMHGDRNKVGTDPTALQAEVESLKRENQRLEKHIERLERLLDKE